MRGGDRRRDTVRHVLSKTPLTPRLITRQAPYANGFVLALRASAFSISISICICICMMMQLHRVDGYRGVFCDALELSSTDWSGPGAEPEKLGRC